MGAKRQRVIAKREKRRAAREQRKSRERLAYTRRVRAGLSANCLPTSLPVAEVLHRIEKTIGEIPDPRKKCTCGDSFGSHFLTLGWPSCSECEECDGYTPELAEDA
jgi:hypothetical protein